MSSATSEIALLEKSGRLEEAARLAASEKLHAEAARLWEQACRFDLAADAALASGDAGRAFLLAARTGDAARQAAAIQALHSNPERAQQVAERARDAGHLAAAARLYRALGNLAKAADNFEQAGLFKQAAEVHRTAADVLAEARCLQRVVREDPGASEARLRLAELLLDQRQIVSGIAMLQRILPGDALRVPALHLLARAFADLGLVEAQRETLSELAEATASSKTEEAFVQAPRVAPVEGVLFGRYRVLGVVETTPTARLYHAEDLLSGTHVAVKIFSAAMLRDTGRDALRKFRQEVEILEQLRHPSIVQLVEYEPSAPASVLRWMEGGSLADLLSRGTVSPARAAEITQTILHALHEAHRRGILHRDIKPSNILFDAGGEAKLSDFGVAHLSDFAATITKGLIGTLAYMAPEQRKGEAASIESDVYGVGAVFWEMLTGAPPQAGHAFLSDKLSAENKQVAEQLIGEMHRRPSSAREAESLIAALGWSHDVPPRRATTPRPASATETKIERLEALPDGSFFDRLLERRVVLLPAEPAVVERARAVCATDAGRALLRYHAGEQTIWVLASADELTRELKQG